VDGLTGAGKTCFAHELAAALRAVGRPTMRASMDDFKHPWRHASEHGYDRVSGEGYRDRYRVAERIYLAEVGPRNLASIIIGNTDFKNPCIMSPRER
jgi:uridine kinase